MPSALSLLGAREAISEKLVEILDAQLNATIDTQFPDFDRNGDLCTDGVVLPRLNTDGIYRYPAPTQEDRKKLADQKQLGVELYLGFLGDSTDEAQYSATQTEQLFEANLPWGAALLFNHTPQDGVSAASQSRTYRPEELMYKRMMRYLEALMYTINKYACRSSEIHDSFPRTDLPVSGNTQLGEGRRGIYGVVYYEFDVETDILFPTHDNL